jgi:hypothetical protein
MTSIPDVNWSRIAGFIRQHTHDLRNELNGLDLEAALLADIVTDSEALEGVGRMRAEIRKVAADLRILSAKFAEPHPSLARLSAQDLFLIWQDQLADLGESPGVDWTSGLAEEYVNVDPSSVAAALREILANARSFGTGAKFRARASVSEGRVILELREPKVTSVDPARWGSTPFASTRRGGYGLGLCSVVRAIESSGGRISWAFDGIAAELVTTISFPVDETQGNY